MIYLKRIRLNEEMDLNKNAHPFRRKSFWLLDSGGTAFYGKFQTFFVI